MLAVALPAPANMTLGQGQCTGRCIVCVSHQQHPSLTDAQTASTPAGRLGNGVQSQTVYETRVHSCLHAVAAVHSATHIMLHLAAMHSKPSSQGSCFEHLIMCLPISAR